MFYKLSFEYLGGPSRFTTNDPFYLLTIVIWARGATFLGYRIEFEDWELAYAEGRFSLKEVDTSRGPGGYPATAIYVTPSGRFPKVEFLHVFKRHSGDGLPNGMADWMVRTLETYESSS
jgi:hypothetical protein